MSRGTRESRVRRHRRIRKRVFGSPERPRLSVYRSLNHLYVQLIDDTRGSTVAAASTLDKEFSSAKAHRANVDAAKKVGGLIAARALQKGLKKIVFDRSGYMYHGQVKALAEGAREAGLEF